MNIFEVSDSEGDKLSIDVQDQFADQGGRFIASVVEHKMPIRCSSVVFGDDAARALIKALRQALPPEETAQAPRYTPRRVDYLQEALNLLNSLPAGFTYDAGDVVTVAHFLAGGER